MLTLCRWLSWTVCAQCLQAELPAEVPAASGAHLRAVLRLLVVSVECDTDLVEFHTRLGI